MALWQTLSDPTVVGYLGSVLLGGTATTALALGGALSVGGRATRWQQAILTSGLVLLWAAPLCALLGSSLGIGQLRIAAPTAGGSRPSDDARVTVGPANTVAPPRVGTGGAVGDTPPRTDTDATPVATDALRFDWLTASLMLWTFGSGIGLLRLLYGARSLHRFRRDFDRSTDPALLHAVREVAAELGMRAPPIDAHPALGAPITLGLFRPRLVVPSQLAAELDAVELRAVLIHELTHVAERHQIVRLAQCLARVVWWWHPLVAVLDRVLRSVQERVCDEEVVVRTGDAHGFARCLVSFAERSHPTPFAFATPGLLLFGSELEVRVTHLLKQENPMRSPIGAAGTMLLILSATVAAAGQAGLSLAPAPQDKQAKDGLGPNDARRYLPLQYGASWHWRFRADDGRTAHCSWRCVRPVTAHGGTTAWELRATHGSYRSWDYRSATSAGIYRFRNAYIQPMRGVSTGSPPIRLVPGPIGAVTQWTWTEVGSVQTSGVGEGPSDDQLRMNYTARIAAMSDPVEVPAGKFDAVRIQTKMTSKYFGETEQTLWLVRDVGIVKRVERGAKSTHTYELEKFTPGKPFDSAGAEMRARKLLATDKRYLPLGAPATLQRLRHAKLERHLLSTFWLARWKNDHKVLVRDSIAGTQAFYPTSIAAWQELAASEDMAPPQDHATELVTSYGLLCALFADPECKPRVRQTQSTAGKTGIRAQARVTTTDAKGTQSGWARMFFRGEKILDLETNLIPQTAAGVRTPR